MRNENDVLFKRFFDKVRKTEYCWEWIGSRTKLGYGQIRIAGILIGAHRVSYEFAYGPFCKSLDVLHKCDNRSCVRPEHLFLGTHRENMQDRDIKQRNNPPRGSRAWKAKLTEDQVIQLREEYRAGALMQDLADKYGVTQPAVSYIINRKQWKHV